ncbi:MAG: hypothetical protein ABJR05_12365 [Balneola sp.]
MKRRKTKAKFNPKKHAFSFSPSLVLFPEEKEHLQEQLWDHIQTVPDKLHDLLGPSASFCHMDQIITSLKKPTIPDEITTGFEYLLMDYYYSWRLIPSEKKFHKKLNHKEYRSYVLKRITDQLLESVEDVYLSELIPKLRVDQEMVDVQLQGHPYFSTQLTVELPIKKDWHQAHAQKNWEILKEKLDCGKPAIILLAGSKAGLFKPNHMIVYDYELLDDVSLVITACNQHRQTSQFRFTFRNGFIVEWLVQGKTILLDWVKSMYSSEYESIKPIVIN